MKKQLTEDFFDRPSLEVAEDLLGKYLVRRINNEEIALKITEVEVYDGPEDKACHAYCGRTKRNEVMFGPAGNFYVYLCYGIHWLLNIVTGPEDYPSALLIRGAGEFDGPGKLTKALGIDDSLNTLKACPENGLWFEQRENIKINYERTPRIGVDYAGKWAKKPYRFLTKI